MVAFEYVALNSDGQKRKGLIEADSKRHARRKLRERGLIPVSVLQPRGPRAVSRARQDRLSTESLALLTRLLGTLLESGVPIDDSLLAMSRQSGERQTRQLVLKIRADILEGRSLRTSMERYPNAFPEEYRATIGAGEQTHHFPLVLKRLADHVDASARTRQKLKVALIYPCVLTVTAMLVVTGLLIFVVPEITRVFDSVDRKLPVATRLLIGASDMAETYGAYAAAAVVIALVLFRRLLRSPGVRAALQRTCMRLPLIGTLIVESGMAHFSRTLAVLLDSGLDLVESLGIASQTTGLLPLRDALGACADSVREGISLSRAMRGCPSIPPLLPHLVASGEGSGNLARMLDTAADTFEHKVANALTVILSLLEPMLILVMGSVVLFIVLAILLPIFDMNQLV